MTEGIGQCAMVVLMRIVCCPRQVSQFDPRAEVMCEHSVDQRTVPAPQYRSALCQCHGTTAPCLERRALGTTNSQQFGRHNNHRLRSPRVQAPNIARDDEHAGNLASSDTRPRDRRATSGTRPRWSRRVTSPGSTAASGRRRAHQSIKHSPRASASSCNGNCGEWRPNNAPGYVASVCCPACGPLRRRRWPEPGARDPLGRARASGIEYGFPRSAWPPPPMLPHRLRLPSVATVSARSGNRVRKSGGPASSRLRRLARLHPPPLVGSLSRLTLDTVQAIIRRSPALLRPRALLAPSSTGKVSF